MSHISGTAAPLCGVEPAEADIPMLYCETTGQGPDVVLVHGWSMHGGVWNSFADRLARRFRLTMVDLPGHGYSPLLSDNSLAGWAKAILAVAPPRAHWLGWSLGATLALQAAAMDAARVQRLIMLCGTPCFVARSDWPYAMPWEVFEGFEAAVLQQGSAALPRFLALQVRGALQPRVLMKQLQGLLEQRPAPLPAALAAGMSMLRTADLRGALAALACPGMAILGANDVLVPAAVAADLQRLAPMSSIMMVDGAAHQPFLTHSAEVADRTMQFFGETL